MADWKKDIVARLVMIGGEKGKSAFDAAVEAGYTGTESEYQTEQANFARNAQIVGNMAANISSMFTVSLVENDDYNLTITLA